MRPVLAAGLLMFASGLHAAEAAPSQLTCADFKPTEAALARYPDLKGACEGIVERDGELYARFTAYVHSVAATGRALVLTLPATNHTFKVEPGEEARVLTGSKTLKPGELVAGQKISIYLSVSELAEPDIDEVAFVTDDNILIDHSAEIDGSIEKPGRVLTSVVKTGAIVESIDYTTREVRLIDADGDRYTIVADPMIEHLDQIKARDRVEIEYLESIAVVVAPGDSTPLMGDGSVLRVTGRGTGEPELTNVETRLVVGYIQAIDAEARTATIKMDDGTVRTVPVAADARLDLVKVGDQVRLRVTEAMALAIRKPTT